ncbi:MAG: hypothetical protein VKJ44_00695 [Synechococcus sp.]|nr:hypothetical protein [Synechococcus sp.]
MPHRLRLLALLALVGGGSALVPPGRAALPAAAAPPVAAAGSARAAAAGGPASGAAAAPPPPPLRTAALPRPPADTDLAALTSACRQWITAGDSERLGHLRQQLLTRHPAPQPLAVLQADAEALLACRMPQAALEVLERISPAAGRERQQWLILQWRAADAALDHRRAALTLTLLAAGQPQRLEALQLPLQRRRDGSWATRSALEVLAGHLEAIGQERSAGSLLLQASAGDAVAAERLGQALRLLGDLPASQREALFERALARVAAAGLWGLASDLLRAQAVLPAGPATLARNRERRLRLSRRLDDAYGLWQTLADDPAAAAQRRQLEQQLRSPRAPGGHAATLPPPGPIQTPAASGGNATGPAGSPVPPGPGPGPGPFSAPSPP